MSTAITQHFASDNYSGICPEALEMLIRANNGHESSYGEDPWTRKACDKFREVFEADCEVFFVFNGTAANALALSSLCQSYHSIICGNLAHLETDECGAPEFFSHGSKLLLAPEEAGKINPAGIHQLVEKRTDIHYPKPKAVSITQATELGTLYSVEEIAAIRKTTKEYGLKLHMDGARFANAVASLDVPPADISCKAEIDVLSLGGSKNGLAMGEAILFFDRNAASEFAYRCKQTGQLASKMRFLAAQWLGILENDAWLRHARHANESARLLEEELIKLPGLTPLFPRQANSVFVRFPEHLVPALRAKGWKFYTFIGGGTRLMCSWDTTEESIHHFVGDLKSLL